MKVGTAARFAAVLTAAAMFGGCTGGESSEPVAEASVSTLDAIIIDVRTPEEFAAGHLVGALLIDIKDATFDARIAELDPEADYIVYCRSGNRSAQAVTRMRGIGIRNITDLGSLENASAETGIAIVDG
jgi:rhodanese-related sulfurtransferase